MLARSATSRHVSVGACCAPAVPTSVRPWLHIRPSAAPVVCQASSSSGPASSSMDLPKRNRPPQPQYYPGIEEEMDISHNAFHSAFESSKPQKMKVEGLQEFAAALWDRRRRIPSSSTSDPLMHIFTEFDQDGDGVLSSSDIAQAFVSHGIKITEKQVQGLIDEFEEDREHIIKKDEWPDFVYSLAVSDLHAKGTYVPGRSLDSMDS